MDGDLVCNFRKCRKRLTSWAWVTSCSHIFCDDDGAREFNKSLVCPACQSNLGNKFDILRVDLQPSEQSKSMLLVGHKPETILEVCSRAMAFWTYQMQQELTYQEYLASKAKERNTQREQFYEQTLSRSQTELSNLKSQLSSMRKEMEEMEKKFRKKMVEKQRQCQKLQTMCDALRRRCINPDHLARGDAEAAHSTPRLMVNSTPFHAGVASMANGIFQIVFLTMGSMMLLKTFSGIFRVAFLTMGMMLLKVILCCDLQTHQSSHSEFDPHGLTSHSSKQDKLAVRI